MRGEAGNTDDDEHQDAGQRGAEDDPDERRQSEHGDLPLQGPPDWGSGLSGLG